MKPRLIWIPLIALALFSALAGFAGHQALGEQGALLGAGLALAAACLAAFWLSQQLKRDAQRVIQAVQEGERSALEGASLGLLGSLWQDLRPILPPRPASGRPGPPPPLRPLPNQQPASSSSAAPTGVPREQLYALRDGLLAVLDHLEGNIELLKKVSALVMDLDGNIKAVAAQGAEASKFNGELLEGSERDGALIAAEIQSLVGIKEALEAGTKVIDDLAASSKEVGPVIESIFVVARKTNMLALNAAIEAARAGEQGRGFAVVAEEVRRLAEAATASTTKVERFVEALREKTSSAVQVLNSARRIEDTIPVVYRISDAFINLVPAVDAANKSLGELSVLVTENMEEIGHLSSAAAKSADGMDESVKKVRDLISMLDRV